MKTAGQKLGAFGDQLEAERGPGRRGTLGSLQSLLDMGFTPVSNASSLLAGSANPFQAQFPTPNIPPPPLLGAGMFNQFAGLGGVPVGGTPAIPPPSSPALPTAGINFAPPPRPGTIRYGGAPGQPRLA